MRTHSARRAAVDPLEELRARLDLCELAIRELQARGAPRDQHDAELRRILADSTQGLAFSASQLLDHAQVATPLARALEDATIQTAAEAVCWLRANKGARDGIVIERRGKRWLATWATSCRLP